MGEEELLEEAEAEDVHEKLKRQSEYHCSFHWERDSISLEMPRCPKEEVYCGHWANMDCGPPHFQLDEKRRVRIMTKVHLRRRLTSSPHYSP